MALVGTCIVPSANRLSMSRYDIKSNNWEIFQHNPNTTGNIPIKRISLAQSIMIEALEKAFVINGEYDGDINSPAKGMLIYDFKMQTWDYKTTRWDRWSQGTVNHLAFDDPSSGYILGFAGAIVSKPWARTEFQSHRILLGHRMAS